MCPLAGFLGRILAKLNLETTVGQGLNTREKANQDERGGEKLISGK